MTPVPDGSKPHVRDTVPEDLCVIIDEMRAEDVAEVLAIGSTPEQSVLQGALHSDPLWTVVDSSGYPVALFGAVPAVLPCGTSVGVVWLLGTPGVTRIRWEFLRQSRRWVNALHEAHGVLWNRIDVRNKLHTDWLKWLGFTMLSPKPIGVNGELFSEFIKVP